MQIRENKPEPHSVPKRFRRWFKKVPYSLVLASSLTSWPNRAPGAEVLAPDVAHLAAEVRDKGWIVWAARSERRDWDLFLMRPDGSQRHALTSTPDWNEAAPQFSRDGTQLLYRRLKRDETISGNRYGEQGQLMLANSDGTNARELGPDGALPWASWSPDGREIASLSIQGVAFVDLQTGKVRRTLPRRGFFQQLTWSPDGRWLSGVANSFGTGWSVARMNADTGEASAVSKINCCTPDWFPDGSRLIYSNRPEGQKANHGEGWTQLWMADPDGNNRRLVYGEDGRHVYGGHISPDGRFAIFTGNPNEDGDPEHDGAPMGLMRISDAPIIGGSSIELRALHPAAHRGPVLALPSGWEPCWTFSEAPSGATPPATASLAAELRSLGWIVASTMTPQGDWDLFLMRPDGTDRRPLTSTPDYNEAGARFSPDGTRLLYYRMPRNDPVDNNTYGTFDLVIADSNGRNPVGFGRGFGWASWGPDGRQIATLTAKGIQIVNLLDRSVVRSLPRQGIVQQLVWSPDGKSFAGTANGLGEFWNIGRLVEGGGAIHSVSETDRYNCTPDWLPDSRHIVYARGIIPKEGGRAELWMAGMDGDDRRMLFAESGRHIYGACPSPDAKYLLFTRSVEDLGAVGKSQTTMAVARFADTPMLGDEDPALHRRVPEAKPGRWLDLGPGWEPHWTFSSAPATR